MAIAQPKAVPQVNAKDSILNRIQDNALRGIRTLSSAVDNLQTRFDNSAVIDLVNDFGLKGDGTDETIILGRALKASQDEKGATLVLPAGTFRIDGGLSIPTSGTPPLQYPVRIVGAGGNKSGGASTSAHGGTILDMRYSGSYGKLLTVGYGHLEIEGITFTDSAGTTTPWIYTTSTTLSAHDNSFFGSKSGIACDQDAIILGGTAATQGTGNPTDGFAGYGTVLRENYFDHIRRAVWGRFYCNSVVIRDNTVWLNSGSGLADGAAIDIDGTGASASAGNLLSGNLVEAQQYPYAIALRNAIDNTLITNSAWDPTATNIAAVLLDSVSYRNKIIGTLGGTKTVNDLGLYNSVITNGGSLAGGNEGSGISTTYYASPFPIPFPANGGTFTPDASTANGWLVTAFTAVASFTIAAPTFPHVGQHLTFFVSNASGGALAVTWNAIFKLAGAWVNPANGFGRTIEFVYDGTNWREVCRVAADVPN